MANTTFTAPPFGVKTPPAPPVAEAAPAAVEAPVAEAPVAKRTRKPSAYVPHPDHPKFVRDNIKKMDYKEMAAALTTAENPVTPQDIATLLQNLKKNLRLGVMKGDGDVKSYADHAEKKDAKGNPVLDFAQPLSEKAKKLELWMEANLTRPKREGGPAAAARAGRGPGKMATVINSSVQSILDEL